MNKIVICFGCDQWLTWCIRIVVLWNINQFLCNDVFLYPLETSENCSDVFWGYRKRTLKRYWLMWKHAKLSGFFFFKKKKVFANEFQPNILWHKFSIYYRKFIIIQQAFNICSIFIIFSYDSLSYYKNLDPLMNTCHPQVR